MEIYIVIFSSELRICCGFVLSLLPQSSQNLTEANLLVAQLTFSGRTAVILRGVVPKNSELRSVFRESSYVLVWGY